MDKKIAFVAMEFHGDHWSDKTYLAISDVLEQVGYDPLRSDQIKTSRAIVDEVCSHLEHDELVVIDSTGNSHSVSYEIGYCHGINRPQDKTILLRHGSGNDIPFNYRHFRHHCYKDLRHLKRILRDWFSVTLPLNNEQFGYCFNIEIKNNECNYGYQISESILSVLKQYKFSGRCEYYASDKFMNGSDNFYVVALGLKNKKNKVFGYEWWLEFVKKFNNELKTKYTNLDLNIHFSELNAFRAIRSSCLPKGTVEFENGIPVLVLNPEKPESDSQFIACINDKIQQKNGPQQKK